MPEVTIYGASDDLVEFDGAIREEFDACSGWAGELVAPDGDSLIVSAAFGVPGARADWTLSVENTDTYPSWPIRFTERPGYEGDPAIVIDVPEGTVVAQRHPKPEED
ncbi:hypothetical protein GS415_03945 [Rhodococcus hoagii]|nr:hypothetical protein [Prescottella equi]